MTLAVHSKAVALLLIGCLLLPLFVWVFLLGLCIVINYLLSVLSSFAVILLRKRELVVLYLLSSCCHVAVCVLCLFLVIPWVGLQRVIMA